MAHPAGVKTVAIGLQGGGSHCAFAWGVLDELLDALAAGPEGGAPVPALLDGQTILLDDYLELRPERAAELRRHVCAGRLLAGPWYANSVQQSPRSAATTTGAYSGRQPAMTALIATLSAVTIVLRPAISPRISWPCRPAPASMAATVASVGGTTGRPSVQPAS